MEEDLNAKKQQQLTNGKKIALTLGGIVLVFVIAYTIWKFVFANNDESNKGKDKNANKNNSNSNPLPSSFFDWSSIPSQDTTRLLQVGQRVALFHMRSGGYVRADQSQLLSTSGTDPKNDSWSQFIVREGDAEFPGTIRLQNVALSGQTPEEGFIAIRIYNDSGWIEMDAKGKKGQYTPLYLYPPDNSAAISAAQLAATENRTVIEPSGQYLPLTLSNPRALLYGSNLYPFLAFSPNGAIVENFKQKATHQSPDSQFLLMRF